MEHISKHLSLVHLPPELKPSKSGEDELSLCLAEPKIRSLETLEPLREALRYVMLLVGVRAANLPKDEEKAVLLSYIVENYGGHTVSEIRLAFKMALSGSLGVEVNCYENFSVLYFTGIMNAYRDWSREAARHIKKEPEALPPARVSDAEFIESIRSLYKINQDFKLIPVLAYKVLGLNPAPEAREAIKGQVNGLIDNPTNEHYKQYAVKKYFDELG